MSDMELNFVTAKYRIPEVLSSNPLCKSMTALEISKILCGADGRASDVNRYLYGLAADGIISKIDARPPRWEMVEKREVAGKNIDFSQLKSSIMDKIELIDSLDELSRLNDILVNRKY